MKKLNKAMSVAVAAAMRRRVNALEYVKIPQMQQKTGHRVQVHPVKYITSESASSWSIRHWIRQHRDLRIS